MRRARAFVGQGRAAMRAEAARGLCRFVFVARNLPLALGDAKTLAPASDISRIRRAMRAPARWRVVVPSPARGRVDLERDPAAQALAGGDAPCCRWFCHFRFPPPPPFRGALATNQSILPFCPHAFLH